MSVEAALAAHLADDDAIYPLVADETFGARVFRVVAPTRAGFPRITFQQMPGGVNVRHLSGMSGLAQSAFQIDIWDRTIDADSTRVISEAVRLALDGFSGTLGVGENTHDVDYIAVDPAADTYTPPSSGGQEGIYNARLTATIWHSQTTE